MNEKQKDEQKPKTYGNQEIPEEILNFKKICDNRCNICNSGILKEIHDWKKDGKTFDRIVELAENNFGVKISPASLSRHFKSYSAFKLEMSTQIIKNDVIEEVTAQAVHIKRTVELLDMAYNDLIKKFKAGIYKIDVADLEKLAKIRYTILPGDVNDDKDLAAIFQLASDKHGLNLQQGVLFKT